MEFRRSKDNDSRTVVVFDPGSTHCGKKDYAFRLIETASEAGADAIKFQLFPKHSDFTDSGNIPLPYDWFPELVRYGKQVKTPIAVTASVFDFPAVELANRYRPEFIKFAYSQQHRKEWIDGLLSIGANVVVSSDVMNRHKLPHDHKNMILLFCQPHYPTMWHTNFDGLFPDLFWGFSDHSLGIDESVKAVMAGARWVEKHIMLPYNDCKECPDGKFALLPSKAKEFVERIRECHSS